MARRTLALAVTVAALAGAGAASASRAPTPRERAAIEYAVTWAPMMGRGNKLTFRKIRVSSIDRRYAMADVFVRDRGGHPIGEPTVLLHHDPQAWRVVFLGTDPPSCKTAPAKVRVDLLGTSACIH